MIHRVIVDLDLYVCMEDERQTLQPFIAEHVDQNINRRVEDG